MAKKSSSKITIEVPNLGEFAYDADAGEWKHRVEAEGISFDLIVCVEDDGAPSEALLAFATHMRSLVLARKHRIPSEIAAKLSRTKGLAWEIPNAESLATKMVWSSVSVYPSKRCEVFFDDGGVLGGHSLVARLSRTGTVSDISIEG